MEDISLKCRETTRHIADKVLLLRRAHKLTQEEFAEQVNLDRRTIARAEDGKHRPSPETMEMIAHTFNVPMSYFYENSVYKKDVSKSALIYEINSRLNVLSKSNLKKVIQFLDIIESLTMPIS